MHVWKTNVKCEDFSIFPGSTTDHNHKGGKIMANCLFMSELCLSHLLLHLKSFHILAVCIHKTLSAAFGLTVKLMRNPMN